jgi:hypothetical protein
VFGGSGVFALISMFSSGLFDDGMVFLRRSGIGVLIWLERAMT